MQALTIRLLMIGCGALLLGHAAVAAPEKAELTAEAKGLVKQFAGRLKPQLKEALAEGGPVMAIGVCADVAPTLADALAAESGWSVGRVSLQPRNVTRAIPDDWERTVLQMFEERAEAGATPQELNVAEIRNGQFRYMQAQGVEALCLLCHGQNITEPVKSALQEYYPDDEATGYALGQVRGAISLSKALQQ